MKLKALVIDDSKIMRQMVMQNLNKAGLAEFEFVEAEDGEDALGKFGTQEIHIAFVDWNMPKMSGIDFVRQVRVLEKREDRDPIQMIMVTSEKTMGKIEEALDQAGADAFIVKPFNAETLQAKLKKVVEKTQIRLMRRAREGRETTGAGKSGFFGGLFS